MNKTCARSHFSMIISIPTAVNLIQPKWEEPGRRRKPSSSSFLLITSSQTPLICVWGCGGSPGRRGVFYDLTPVWETLGLSLKPPPPAARNAKPAWWMLNIIITRLEGRCRSGLDGVVSRVDSNRKDPEFAFIGWCKRTWCSRLSAWMSMRQQVE